MRLKETFLSWQTAEMYPQASHGSNRILHLGIEGSSQLYKSLSEQALGHNKSREEGNEQQHFFEGVVLRFEEMKKARA